MKIFLKIISSQPETTVFDQRGLQQIIEILNERVYHYRWTGGYKAITAKPMLQALCTAVSSKKAFAIVNQEPASLPNTFKIVVDEMPAEADLKSIMTDALVAAGDERDFASNHFLCQRSDNSTTITFRVIEFAFNICITIDPSTTRPGIKSPEKKELTVEELAQKRKKDILKGDVILSEDSALLKFWGAHKDQLLAQLGQPYTRSFLTQYWSRLVHLLETQAPESFVELGQRVCKIVAPRGRKTGAAQKASVFLKRRNLYNLIPVQLGPDQPADVFIAQWKPVVTSRLTQTRALDEDTARRLISFALLSIQQECADQDHPLTSQDIISLNTSLITLPAVSRKNLQGWVDVQTIQQLTGHLTAVTAAAHPEFDERSVPYAIALGKLTSKIRAKSSLTEEQVSTMVGATVACLSQVHCRLRGPSFVLPDQTARIRLVELAHPLERKLAQMLCEIQGQDLALYEQRIKGYAGLGIIDLHILRGINAVVKEIKLRCSEDFFEALLFANGEIIRAGLETLVLEASVSFGNGESIRTEKDSIQLVIGPPYRKSPFTNVTNGALSGYFLHPGLETDDALKKVVWDQMTSLIPHFYADIPTLLTYLSGQMLNNFQQMQTPNSDEHTLFLDETSRMKTKLRHFIAYAQGQEGGLAELQAQAYRDLLDCYPVTEEKGRDIGGIAQNVLAHLSPLIAERKIIFLILVTLARASIARAIVEGQEETVDTVLFNPLLREFLSAKLRAEEAEAPIPSNTNLLALVAVAQQARALTEDQSKIYTDVIELFSVTNANLVAITHSVLNYFSDIPDIEVERDSIFEIILAVARKEFGNVFGLLTKLLQKYFPMVKEETPNQIARANLRRLVMAAQQTGDVTAPHVKGYIKWMDLH
jgi:hypothetical protein